MLDTHFRSWESVDGEHSTEAAKNGTILQLILQFLVSSVTSTTVWGSLTSQIYKNCHSAKYVQYVHEYAWVCIEQMNSRVCSHVLPGSFIDFLLLCTPQGSEQSITDSTHTVHGGHASVNFAEKVHWEKITPKRGGVVAGGVSAAHTYQNKVLAVSNAVSVRARSLFLRTCLRMLKLVSYYVVCNNGMSKRRGQRSMQCCRNTEFYNALALDVSAQLQGQGEAMLPTRC